MRNFSVFDRHSFHIRNRNTLSVMRIGAEPTVRAAKDQRGNKYSGDQVVKQKSAGRFFATANELSDSDRCVFPPDAVRKDPVDEFIRFVSG